MHIEFEKGRRFERVKKPKIVEDKVRITFTLTVSEIAIFDKLKVEGEPDGVTAKRIIKDAMSKVS